MRIMVKIQMKYIILSKRLTNIMLQEKDLLEENIQYTFTMLRIYTKGYDVNFLAEKYRQPLTICESKNFIASGIQRTGDLHLNLPLI